jgi:hypothetical protein
LPLPRARPVHPPNYPPGQARFWVGGPKQLVL